MITLDHPLIAEYFGSDGHGNWEDKQLGCILKGAILDFYRSVEGFGYNGLTLLGLPRTHEGQWKGAVVQLFERGILAYDPTHILDYPPGSGLCYLLHYDAEILAVLKEEYHMHLREKALWEAAHGHG